MSRDRRRDPPKSAAQLMAELQKDPEYQARISEQAQRRRQNEESYARATEPILKDLAAIGFEVENIGELRKTGKYRAAIPTLLRWLPLVSDRHVKEDIIRTLSVPWAKPQAAPALIEEFKKTGDEGLRWAVANALEVVADDTVFEEIAYLVQDRRYGKAREMLVVSLGNMKDPRAVDLLIALLDDDDVVGHAVIGLGKLKPPAARERILALTKHPVDWIRVEAGKALAHLASN